MQRSGMKKIVIKSHQNQTAWICLSCRAFFDVRRHGKKCPYCESSSTAPFKDYKSRPRKTRERRNIIKRVWDIIS